MVVTSPVPEIIFEVSEDEIDGGYSASALGYGIHTEGETVEEIRGNIREAVECYFDETMPRPGFSSILKSVAAHHEVSVDELLEQLGL